MRTLILFSILTTAISHSNQSWAEDKAAVLDFEAEVIEGQKRAPEVFLQTTVEKPSLEEVLYQRKNFNDFHAVDSKLRPRLSDPAEGARKK